MKNRKLVASARFRIAMICAHSCPVGKLGAKDTGGMSVYVRELAGELARCGHTVDVYTRVHDPNDAQVISLENNARLIHLRAGEDSVIDKMDVFPHLPEFTRQMESYRKQNGLQYDLIYSHYWLSAWVGKRLQSRWGVPHMVMFHTLGALKNAIGIGEGEPWIRVETEKYLARNSHRIIVATEKEKQDIIFHYGAPEESIAVIPCGVNLELFRPSDKETAKRKLGLDEEDRTILFVGRIDPLKGIDKLLAALARMDGRDRLRLLIIGGDESSQHEIKKLNEMARALDVQDRVASLGLIRQTELPVYYNAADLCVVPSYYESFGLVALESLACGTPVVTTRVGGAENIVRQREMGYVVESNSPRHLAEKMELLLSGSTDGRTQAGALRELAEKFSWANVARRLTRECRAVSKSYYA